MVDIGQLSKISQNDLLIVTSWDHSCEDLLALLESRRSRRTLLGPNIQLDSRTLEYLSNAEYLYGRFLVPNSALIEIKKQNWPHIKWEAWAAGIDTRYWSPNSKMRERILVYVKDAPLDRKNRLFLDDICANYEVILIEYGRYSPKEYRKALRQCYLMICLGTEETQGLALAEAWSCDVPSYVRIPIDYKSLHRSYAPYLSRHTGNFFTIEHASLDIFDISEIQKSNFAPRSWIKENLSIEICTKKLIELLD